MYPTPTPIPPNSYSPIDPRLIDALDRLVRDTALAPVSNLLALAFILAIVLFIGMLIAYLRVVAPRAERQTRAFEVLAKTSITTDQRLEKMELRMTNTERALQELQTLVEKMGDKMTAQMDESIANAIKTIEAVIAKSMVAQTPPPKSFFSKFLSWLVS